MAKPEVYVVHEDTETIVLLKECRIIVIKEDNDSARGAAYNGYATAALEKANEVYYPSEVTDALDIY